MSDEGPTKETRVNTSACLRFKGEGWSSDVAEKFSNKNEIAAPTNRTILTEVRISFFFALR